jgi:hypothetical protein
MGIKRKIKIRKVTGIGVHGLATGDSLDLSDNAKASDELPALDGESVGRDVPADEMSIVRFEEHTDKEYAEHCRKFFKGEVE